MNEIRPFPERLYRYRPKVSEHFWDDLISAVKDSAIWIHPVTEQNDPFDSSPVYSKAPRTQIRSFLKVFFKKHPGYSIGGTNIRKESEARGDLPSRIRKLLSPTKEAAELFSNSTIDVFKEDRKNYCISCFSDRSDSVVMWSHYSDKHTGICIEFSARGKPKFQHISIFDFVRYQNERPIITDLELMKFISCFNFDDSEMSDKKIMDKILTALYLTKSKDWEYEQEWRVASRTCGSEYISIAPMYVSAVLIGVHAPPDLEKEIRCRLKEFPGAQVKRMKLSNTEFSIRAV